MPAEGGVRALIHLAQDAGVEAGLLCSAEVRNQVQKRLLFDKLVARFGARMTGLRFGLWGLAFKPGTDDTREAPPPWRWSQSWSMPEPSPAFSIPRNWPPTASSITPSVAEASLRPNAPYSMCRRSDKTGQLSLLPGPGEAARPRIQ